MKEITNVNGTPVVTFEEQRDRAVEALKDGYDPGVRPMNPDGTVARSRVITAAINEDVYYDNRYRVVDDQIQLVIAQTTDGYLAIKEQATGRVPKKQIQAYVLAREGGKLVFKGTVMIGDEDFVADFTHKLNKEVMKDILPLLVDMEPTEDEKLPI